MCITVDGSPLGCLKITSGKPTGPIQSWRTM